MSELGAIHDGAILLRNGRIENVGSTRQVENLAVARKARVIEAAGRVVMPAFVDPDTTLTGPARGASAESKEADMRRVSKHRLESRAAAVAADMARYGVLTVGSHTLFAPDLRTTSRALRLHQAMQSKPLRIRSIFSPAGGELAHVAELWMPPIYTRKLASILEIPVTSGQEEAARKLATAAAKVGFNIRLRVAGPTTQAVLELALAAGAISVIGGIPEASAASLALADAGCVTIGVTTRILSGDYKSKRKAIDEGIPLALGSGYRQDSATSMNPQFELYMACHQLGMKIEEAIVAASHNAACALRLSHVTGSLAPGKAGDICVMDVEDYRELNRRAGHHDVSLVLRAGQVVYRRGNLISG
jgi:imidazolonepropionase